jgi:hypothetical protein
VTSDFEPPSEVLVNRRWIKPERVEWALEADAILRGHGSVHGQTVYDERWQARNRARKLISLLVDLDLFERWELAEHTNRIPPSSGKGWQWAVEYVGGGPIDGRR